MARVLLWLSEGEAMDMLAKIEEARRQENEQLAITLIALCKAEAGLTVLQAGELAVPAPLHSEWVVKAYGRWALTELTRLGCAEGNGRSRLCGG
jgi:hypothetical protein